MTPLSLQPTASGTQFASGSASLPGRLSKASSAPLFAEEPRVDHLVEQVIEQLQLALARTGYTCLRDVQMSVEEGLVVLKGRVPSYYLKQRAQVAALEIESVRGVRNELEVYVPR
jgi:osmotically-inducible protein OsmY